MAVKPREERANPSSSVLPAIPATACRSPACSSPRVGACRQRSQHPAGLPGRDPRAGGHARPARLRVPGQVLESRGIHTPGDDLDVLVAMNPAALKINLGDLQPNGILIVDKEQFNEQNLKKAGYKVEPARRTARSTASGLRGRHHQADRRHAATPNCRRTHGESLQEFLRTRVCVVAVPSVRSRSTSKWIHAEVRRRPPSARAPTGAS